ncbi:MAG: glycerol transporter [Pycnora praestabilis]|nr:MAG: glycerol transporter [Pycnora praestabilis]
MEWLHYLRRLYSLDTLDTRFTISSRTPLKPNASKEKGRIDSARPSPIDKSTKIGGVDVGVSENGGNGIAPSRWRTAEFAIYYIVFLLCVPMMFKAVYDVSKDDQYSAFRNNIPYMFALLILHPLLRRLYNSFYPLVTETGSDQYKTEDRKATGSISPQSSPTMADARMSRRVSFDLSFAALLLLALHGISAFKILLILYINFDLATRLPKEQIPRATWIFNIFILFANETSGGYSFMRFASMVSRIMTAPGAEVGKSTAFFESLGARLDSFDGLVPRWEILFNIVVLRLISFNLDYYWSIGPRSGSPVEVCHYYFVGFSGAWIDTVLTDAPKKKQLDPSNLSERDRIAISANPQDYSFRNYLAYVLYSPLYLAGPILTFNDFIAQLRYSPPSITTSRTVLYGIRFLITLLTMELMLHFIYAVAISKSQPVWEAYTPFQLSMLGYFNLHIIWLKLLLPWRFFRFWALLDGIDPPENMVRCMSDNYSTLAFWRGWHRSFNRWIVRYIYIPLGGSGGPSTHGTWGKARAVLNFLAVFTFVALWHDINLKLLMWGWLITLFILPEVLAGFLFPKSKWRDHPEAYRVICGIGAVGNILMMMAANLVGFAVGLDGLQGLVNGIVGSYSGKQALPEI